MSKLRKWLEGRETQDRNVGSSGKSTAKREEDVDPKIRLFGHLIGMSVKEARARQGRKGLKDKSAADSTGRRDGASDEFQIANLMEDSKKLNSSSGGAEIRFGHGPPPRTGCGLDAIVAVALQPSGGGDDTSRSGLGDELGSSSGSNSGPLEAGARRVGDGGRCSIRNGFSRMGESSRVEGGLEEERAGGKSKGPAAPVVEKNTQHNGGDDSGEHPLSSDDGDPPDDAKSSEDGGRAEGKKGGGEKAEWKGCNSKGGGRGRGGEGRGETEEEIAKAQAQEASARGQLLKKPEQVVPCPRCESLDTKFCYYNNYNMNQPRHFCKNCQRYWTAGGVLRNVPIGAGRRKNKQAVAAAKGGGRGENCMSAMGAGGGGGGAGGGGMVLNGSEECLHIIGSQRPLLDDSVFQASGQKDGCASVIGGPARSSGSAFTTLSRPMAQHAKPSVSGMWHEARKSALVAAGAVQQQPPANRLEERDTPLGWGLMKVTGSGDMVVPAERHGRGGAGGGCGTSGLSQGEESEEVVGEERHGRTTAAMGAKDRRCGGPGGVAEMEEASRRMEGRGGGDGDGLERLESGCTSTMALPSEEDKEGSCGTGAGGAAWGNGDGDGGGCFQHPGTSGGGEGRGPWQMMLGPEALMGATSGSGMGWSGAPPQGMNPFGYFGGPWQCGYSWNPAAAAAAAAAGGQASWGGGNVWGPIGGWLPNGLWPGGWGMMPGGGGMGTGGGDGMSGGGSGSGTSWQGMGVPWESTGSFTGLRGEGTSPSPGVKRPREEEVSSENVGEDGGVWVPKMFRRGDVGSGQEDRGWQLYRTSSDKSGGEQRGEDGGKRTHRLAVPRAMHANPAALSRAAMFRELS